MMTKNSLRLPIVWLFVAVQVVGEICFWTSPFITSSAGRYVWAVGFLLLLPGNQLSAIAIEELFWNRLSQPTMAVIAVPIEILLNGVAWLVATFIALSIRRIIKR